MLLSRLSAAACSTAALAALLVVAPAGNQAWAQKSKDTLRHLQDLPVATVDNYYDPRPEVQFLSEAAYDNLIVFDFRKNDFAPSLAKSWKTIDDTTYEFVLRDDIKWSDGQPFTADDVVYTVNWWIDPKVKLRFKANWSFIARAEKVGPHTVRIITKEPTPHALAQLTAQSTMLPQHVHSKLDNYELFGAKPVGTGPYRITQVDKNRGVIGELRPDYPHASNVKRKPTIGRFEVRGVGDTGTQVAEFLTGNIDLIRNVSVDQAENLMKDPRFGATGTDPAAITYFLLDMKGRTGNKALTDVRVRQAINHAIDTTPLQMLLGGKILDLKRPAAFCVQQQRGCGFSVPQPNYDPALAKKLLAEAGYANGFDLEIIARPGAGETLAKAMTGQLRAVGIRASANIVSFAAYRKIQEDGKQQALVSGWGGGNVPDVSSTLSFLFEPGSRDYHGNQKWFDLADAASKEMDDAKRRNIVKQLSDEVTEQGYMTMIATSPTIWAHSKDIVIDPNNQPFFGYGLTMGEISWKK